MSLVEKEISSVVGGSGGGGGCVVGDDGDDDDEECGGSGSGSGSGSGGSHGRCGCSEEKAKKQRGFSGGGLSRNFRKAKQVVLHPFGRSKKQLPRKAKPRASASGSSYFASSCAFSSGKRFGGDGGNGGGNKGCYFCFTQSPTLDSPMGSQTSDPEHPNFTFGMLRAFVESNEFYSKDCNPHLDIDVSSYKMD